MKKDNFSEFSQIKSRLISGNKNRDMANITFVIPTYKRPEKIRVAVNSILAQKTKHSFDIVVVDNEPEKDTDTQKYFESLCKQNGNVLYYKNEENIGMFPNWNRCYELAQGEWCCILMSDDELKPDYLDRIVETQQKYGLDCVRVGSDIFDKNGLHVREKSYFERRYHNIKGHLQKIDTSYFIFRGALPPSGMFVRRKIILDLGGYDLRYFPGSDFEFDTRLVHNYKVGMLWERLCITHTDDSTSMRKDVISQSIMIGHKICGEVYRDAYKDHRWTAVLNDIKSFIAIEKSGLDKGDYQDLNSKFDKKMYKNIYKIAYYFNRLLETVGIR